jgi:hypothetical protein
MKEEKKKETSSLSGSYDGTLWYRNHGDIMAPSRVRELSNKVA